MPGNLITYIWSVPRRTLKTDNVGVREVRKYKFIRHKNSKNDVFVTLLWSGNKKINQLSISVLGFPPSLQIL